MRKIAGLEIDQIKLAAIDRIAGEYSSNNPSKNMKDIVMISITAQICYQEVTLKPFLPSAWRTNIEVKIRKSEDHANLLKRFLNKEDVDQKSKTEALKILRVKRLFFQKHMDIQQAISEYEESILVYQKKINIHEKSKEFRKENRKYELFIRRFYRVLENETEGKLNFLP